jgi:hypothetical protein
VSEAERVRHHRAHIKKVEAAAEKRRLQNLALARETKRQADRENKEVYG